MTAKELRDKRVKAIADARAINDAAGDKGMSAEDLAKFDAFMADARNCDEQLKRLADLEASERAMAEADRNVVPQSVRGAAPLGVPDAMFEVTTEEQRTRQAIATPEYGKAFWRAVRRSYAGISDVERRALQVGNDAEGGYLVPDEFERSLIQGLNDPVIMRGLGTVIPSVSGDKTIPFVSSHGSASWTAEEQSASESDEAFGAKRFGAHKLTRLIKVSIELLQDNAFNLEGYIRSEYQRAFAAAEDTAFISGVGVNRPRGFTMDGTAGITAAGTTSVTADELIRLKHSLKRAYRKTARWFMADATVSAVSRLKDGDGRYIWQPGLTLDAPDVLLGRPVEISDDMPALTSGLKPIWFGDPSYYYIVDRAGFYMQILRELYAVNGQVGFLGYRRVDGKLLLDEAMRYITLA